MQLPEQLRGILRGRGALNEGRAAQNPEKPQPPQSAQAESASTRASRGLEEFFASIRDLYGLNILDLGGATQQNVSFITNLGHRLYSEDFLRMLGETFGLDDAGSQSNPGQIEFFLRQTLDYPEAHFDGVLIWDTLEYLSPALLAAVVTRLRKIVRPKSHMLAFFPHGRPPPNRPHLHVPHQRCEDARSTPAGLTPPRAALQQPRPGEALRRF